MKAAHSTRHGFLGIGRMAEVILRALLKAGILRPHQVMVSRQSAEELRKIARNLRVSPASHNSKLAASSQVVWLGIKPYQAAAVLKEIAPHLPKDATILSMMAGISTAFIQKRLGKKWPVVRLMPNTPAAVGAGMTGVFFTASVRPQMKKFILKALGALGEVSLCNDERDLDAITGLSGSGVAFVYEFCRAMIDGGVKSGLSLKASLQIARQTFFGAAQMLRQSGRDPAELVAQVVSKGGTTEAGLKLLRRRKLDAAIAQAVVAATRRARALRKENEK